MDESKLLGCLKRRHYGRANAVKSPVLETRFEVTGKAIRDAVNALRCAGHPICSDENGYYYAVSQSEINATVAQLDSRIAKISKARNGLANQTEKEE